MDEDLAKFLAILLAASVAYGKALGPSQCQISEWAIQGFRVASRWRGLVNLGVGMVLAASIAAVAAFQASDWRLLPFAVLAGILASVEAARVHDQGAA